MTAPVKLSDALEEMIRDLPLPCAIGPDDDRCQERATTIATCITCHRGYLVCARHVAQIQADEKVRTHYCGVVGLLRTILLFQLVSS